MIDSFFWNKKRTLITAIAVAIGLIAAISYIAITDDVFSSAITRGDFPAFFSPVIMLHRGLVSALYDMDIQAQIEREFWPSLDNLFLPSVYPPFFYGVLYPLGFLGPIAAHLVYSTIQLILFVLSVAMIRKAFSSSSHSDNFVAAVFLLSCTAILCGVFGGQNVGLTCCIYATSITILKKAIKNLETGRSYRSLLMAAGMVIGLLLFKPQFGLICGFGFSLLGGIWATLGLATMGIFLYLLSCFVAGGNWIGMWLSALSSFRLENLDINRGQLVSLSSWIMPLKTAFHFAHNEKFVIGIVLLLHVIVCLGFWRAWHKTKNLNRINRLVYLSPLIGASTVILAPHAMFYDLGLPLLAYAWITPKTNLHAWGLICGWFILNILTLQSQSSPIPALSIVGFLLWLVAYSRCCKASS